MADQNLRTLADLRASSPPDFFDRDIETIKRRLVQKFEADTNKTLFEGQPEMFWIETLAYALAVRAEAEQNAALQNTIVWAEGRHLEALAANVSVFRLLEQKARTTLRFVREVASLLALTIPAGTRLSGGGITFALVDDLIIPAGALEAEGTAMALTPGSLANGIQPFAINQLVDALPAGVNGYNVTITAGGADAEDYERLRERAANGNFRISKGGPRNGYRELVKALHPDIVDVGVIRPQAGYIDIHPLLATGAPGAEIRNLIADGLDPEEDIPMGDFVTIKDPVARIYDFTLIARIQAVDPALEGLVRATVEAVFFGWSQTMGVQVSPSLIISEVRRIRGVIDAEVIGLAFDDLARTEYAVLGELNLDIRVMPDV